MNRMPSRSLLALVFCALTACFLPACENPEEDIDLTVSELKDAAARRDGTRFIALIAPEAFSHYDRLIHLALTANAEQLFHQSIMDKLEIAMMRNRSTKKELSAMDGRAWVAKAVQQGWYSSDTSAEEELGVHDRNITVRGSTAIVEIVYDARWGFGGSDHFEHAKETMNFIKVEDRWLYDFRRQSEFWEKYIAKIAALNLNTPEQVIESIESRLSGKNVTRHIWDGMK